VAKKQLLQLLLPQLPLLLLLLHPLLKLHPLLLLHPLQLPLLLQLLNQQRSKLTQPNKKADASRLFYFPAFSFS
jgi:hypothetical protein